MTELPKKLNAGLHHVDGTGVELLQLTKEVGKYLTEGILLPSQKDGILILRCYMPLKEKGGGQSEYAETARWH